MAHPAPSPRLRRFRPLLLRLLVAGVATLAALLLVEIYLQLFPIPYVYMRMRNLVHQYCTRPHPTIQFVNREGFVGPFNNREFRTTIRINSKGLRDRE